jgi:hypothetical protein
MSERRRERERERERDKIDSENLKIVHKLVTARGEIEPEKIKKHQELHHNILDRISKTKRRKQLRHIMLSKYNLEALYFLPDIHKERSI